MNIFGNTLPYDVNQRQIQCQNGEILWRVSYTGDTPLAIDRSRLFDFARQLGLTYAEVSAVLGTEAFPPLLVSPGNGLRAKMGAQWLHKPAVAALLALAAAKHDNSAE